MIELRWRYKEQTELKMRSRFSVNSYWKQTELKTPILVELASSMT